VEKIMQFFNPVLPCPVEIPECDRLRVEFLNELDELKRRGGCSKCAENNIKNKYIIKLQQIIK
jgi:hypothetical protein